MVVVLWLAMTPAVAATPDLSDGSFHMRFEPSSGSLCVEFPVDEAIAPCTGTIGTRAAAAVSPLTLIRLMMGQVDDWRYIVTVTRAAPILELSPPEQVELMTSVRVGARAAAGLPDQHDDDQPAFESRVHGVQVLRTSFDVGYALDAPARAVAGHTVVLAAVTRDGLYMVTVAGPPEHSTELSELADAFGATIEAPSPPPPPRDLALNAGYYLGYACAMLAIGGGALALLFVIAAVNRYRSADDAA